MTTWIRYHTVTVWYLIKLSFDFAVTTATACSLSPMCPFCYSSEQTGSKVLLIFYKHIASAPYCKHCSEKYHPCVGIFHYYNALAVI